LRRRRFVERTKNSLMSGFYGVIILALIDRFGPIYGYKIMKFMNEHSSGFFNPSESTIYTLLGHLEKEGLVRSFWALTGEGIPRKYYELSEKGREALEDLLGYVRSLFKALGDILGGDV